MTSLEFGIFVYLLVFWHFSCLHIVAFLDWIVAFWYCDWYRPFGTAVVIYNTNETFL